MEKSNSKVSLFKKLGWISIGLCGLCCTLPVIGGLIGVGSATAIAYYFEKTSIIILVLGGIFFIYIITKKKQLSKNCSTTCGTDCGCRTETDLIK